MKKQDFIKEIAPAAKSVQERYSILPSLIISQACLESNFGNSQLAIKGNNLFGVKGSHNGDYLLMSTKEWDAKKGWYQVQAKFRKYPSWKESVEDHALLFKNGLSREKSNRYAAIIGESDYKKAIIAVKNAGYATDPGYPELLNKLIVRYNLTQYDNRAIGKITSPEIYIVQAGDTLSKIARQHQITIERLVDLNQIKNPNIIYAGQKLSVLKHSYYHVVPGDTLSKIALSFGITTARLTDLNDLKNPDNIYPNQRLRIN